MASDLEAGYHFGNSCFHITGLMLTQRSKGREETNRGQPDGSAFACSSS